MGVKKKSCNRDASHRFCLPMKMNIQGSLPGRGSLFALFSTVETGKSARCRNSPCMSCKLGVPPWIPLWRLNFLISFKKKNHGGERQAFKIIISVGLAADTKSTFQAEKVSL